MPGSTDLHLEARSKNLPPEKPPRPKKLDSLECPDRTMLPKSRANSADGLSDIRQSVLAVHDNFMNSDRNDKSSAKSNFEEQIKSLQKTEAKLKIENENLINKIVSLKKSIGYYKNESFDFTENMTRQNEMFLSWQKQLQSELLFLTSLLSSSQKKKYDTWKLIVREKEGVDEKSLEVKIPQYSFFSRSPSQSSVSELSSSRLQLGNTNVSSTTAPSSPGRNLAPASFALCFGNRDGESVSGDGNLTLPLPARCLSQSASVSDTSTLASTSITSSPTSASIVASASSWSLLSRNENLNLSNSETNCTNRGIYPTQNKKALGKNPMHSPIFSSPINRLSNNLNTSTSSTSTSTSLTNFEVNEKTNYLVKKALADKEVIKNLGFENEQLKSDKESLVLQLGNRDKFGNNDHERITTLQNQVRELHKTVVSLLKK